MTLTLPTFFLLISAMIILLILLFVFIAKSANRKSSIEGLRSSFELLERQLEEKSKEYQKLNDEKTELLRSNSAAEIETKHLREKLKSENHEMEKRQKQLQNEFTVLFQNILDERSERLASLEKEKLETILAPFKKNLKDFEERVEKTHKEETDKLTRLDHDLKQLMNLNRQLDEDAKGLTRALKGDNKTQGNWGEWQLEKILEKSGLEKGIHYQTQTSFTEEGKKKQPDFIIQLPDGKHLVIDAKVSLTAYDQYFSSESETDRNSYLVKHVRSVKSHIQSLGRKEYQSLNGMKSPDYILMFVPIEPAFAAAFRHEDSLYQLALDNNIVVVTTSTLLATMKTVAFIWTQENQRKNVLEIARQGGLMYDRLASLFSELQKMGNQLQTVQNSYDSIMKKVGEGKGNLIQRAEKMKKLGAQTSKSLPENLSS